MDSGAKSKNSDFSLGAKISRSTRMSIESCLNPNPRMTPRTHHNNSSASSASHSSNSRRHDVSLGSSISGKLSSSESLSSEGSLTSQSSLQLSGFKSSNDSRSSTSGSVGTSSFSESINSHNTSRGATHMHNWTTMDHSFSGLISGNLSQSLNCTVDSIGTHQVSKSQVRKCERPVKEYCSRNLPRMSRRLEAVDVSNKPCQFPEMTTVLRNPGKQFSILLHNSIKLFSHFAGDFRNTKKFLSKKHMKRRSVSNIPKIFLLG